VSHQTQRWREPDVSNVGGITAWLKVAHLAQSQNLPVTSHGVHDLHVHLLAAVPNASWLEPLMHPSQALHRRIGGLLNEVKGARQITDRAALVALWVQADVEACMGPEQNQAGSDCR
jgi:L-alanine-DL-glutamate epimerase-like enolase superfamily enzyme